MHAECRHIKPNGYKCRSAALRKSPYCYYHDRLHRLALEKSATATRPLELPFPEDRAAILMSLGMIFQKMGARKLDPQRTGHFLYGLQIASQNVDRDPAILPRNTVINITHTKDGQELAPKDLACDAPQDCVECDRREFCLKRRTMVGLQGGFDELAENDAEENEEREDDDM
jgi:hypothetical protein